MTRRGAWLFGVIVGALAWMILRHLEATSPYTARTESTVASLIQGFQAGVRE